MLSSSRRNLILAAAALVLAACGFTPAYAPGGVGEALRSRIEARAPTNRLEFDFVARLEERIGRADPAQYRLAYTITIRSDALAITPDQALQRYHLIGTLDYQISSVGTGQVLAEGKIQNFAAYSAVGTTVATRAAEADAQARLATILADQLVTRLLATGGDWQA